MDKWEYFEAVRQGSIGPSYIDWLNEMGQEGWEVVNAEIAGGGSTRGMYVLFKRRIESSGGD